MENNEPEEVFITREALATSTIEPFQSGSVDPESAVADEEQKKYFGAGSRDLFFQRYHWVCQQLFNMNVNSKDSVPCLYFDNEESRLDGNDESESSSDRSIPLLDLPRERPTTSRTLYLEGCSRENMSPRPYILRKDVTNIISLQCQGIGDKKALLIAESLKGLPYVETINLADNNLTDESCMSLITAFSLMDTLKEVNLSKNSLKTQGCIALARYIYPGIGSKKLVNDVGTKKCPLQKLYLHQTGLTDLMAQLILYAISLGGMLTDLDLSHNKIGNSDKFQLSPRSPRSPRGAEVTVSIEELLRSANYTSTGDAIAQVLLSPQCNLQSLNVSWNSISASTVNALCAGLIGNKTLTSIDLAHNSMGGEAGINFGAALLENSVLRTVDLSYNNIDSNACISICQGVLENESMSFLCLDGNPIGEQGARAVMRIPIIIGYRASVSIKNCNIVIKYPNCWFDFSSICRPYCLHLDNALDRAIAMVLLQIAARSPEYRLSNCSHSQEIVATKHGTPLSILTAGKEKDQDKRKNFIGEAIELTLVESNDKLRHLNSEQMKQIEALQILTESVDNIERATELFLATDVDGSGEIDSDELLKLLHFIGMTDVTPEQVDSIIRAYDSNGYSTTLSYEEFCLYIQQQAGRFRSRLKDMTSFRVFVEKKTKNPNKKYFPPKSGMMYVDIHPGASQDQESRAISSLEKLSLYDTALNTVDHLAMVGYALQGTKIRLEEAQGLYLKLYNEARDKAVIVSMILPYFAEVEDARQFVMYVTEHDYNQLAYVKRIMGNVLRPALGYPDGYYYLNLSVDLDRICMNRLLELNASISRKRILDTTNSSLFGGPGVIGDTSQKGNWSCFRNEVLNGSSVTITNETFIPIPTHGFVEFDFVSGYRPVKDQGIIISDSKLLNLLNNCCLMRKNEFSKYQEWLDQLYTDCCRFWEAVDGRNGPHTYGPVRATAVHTHMLKFYSKLVGRGAAYSQGGHAEKISFNYMDVVESLEVMKEEIRKEQMRNSKPNSAPSRGSMIARPLTSTEDESGSSSSDDEAHQSKLFAKTRRLVPAPKKTALRSSALKSKVNGTTKGKTVKVVPPSEPVDFVARPSTAHYRFFFDDDDPDLADIKGVRLQPILPTGVKRSRNTVIKNTRRYAAVLPLSQQMVERGSAQTEGAQQVEDSSVTPFTAEESELDKKLKIKDKSLMHRLFVKRIRFKKLLLHPSVPAEAKISRIVNALEESLTRVWITSRQLALVMKCLHTGGCGFLDEAEYAMNESEKGAGGLLWRSRSYGTYRVELIVSLFSRILDLHNFDLVTATLTNEEYACLLCRLGWLNIFNPLKPESDYVLCLNSYEERQVFKICAALSDVEAGVNFVGRSYLRPNGEPFIGWDLTVSWMGEKLMPRDGIVSFTFTSGDGKPPFEPRVSFRLSLCKMVLLDEREIFPEDEDDGSGNDDDSVTSGGEGKKPKKVSRRRPAPTTNTKPSAMAQEGGKSLEEWRARNGRLPSFISNPAGFRPVEYLGRKFSVNPTLSEGEQEIKSRVSGKNLGDVWHSFLGVSSSNTYYKKLSGVREK